MTTSESSRILAGVIAGEDDAAKHIFDRYVNRLVALARTRLSASLRARVDAEDIVQSVFRSFFRKLKDDETVLRRSGDLWRLLAAITVNKSRKRVEFELAQKRNPQKEVAVPNAEAILADDPGPENAVILIDELSAFMSGMDVRNRRILEFRFQGDRIDAIALETGVSEATVRRVLKRAGSELERRLLDE